MLTLNTSHLFVLEIFADQKECHDFRPVNSI